MYSNSSSEPPPNCPQMTCTFLLAFFNDPRFFFNLLFHLLELVQLCTPMCLQLCLACRAHCDLISLPCLKKLCLSYMHGLHDLLFPLLEAQLNHLLIFEHCTTQLFFLTGDCLLYSASNRHGEFHEPRTKRAALCAVLCTAKANSHAMSSHLWSI